MIVRIHPNANGRAQHPMVRKRFGPQRIDFEARRHLRTLGLSGDAVVQQDFAGGKRQKNGGKATTDQKIARDFPVGPHAHAPLHCCMASANENSPDRGKRTGVRRASGRAKFSPRSRPDGSRGQRRHCTDRARPAAPASSVAAARTPVPARNARRVPRHPRRHRHRSRR